MIVKIISLFGVIILKKIGALANTLNAPIFFGTWTYYKFRAESRLVIFTKLQHYIIKGK